MTNDPSQDRAHLARAIALASQMAGATNPNPNVGCVVVADGRVVGEGATAPAGGPHAEVVALERAGRDARGATAYVTLEPCSHHGRTPPCTEALVGAGVARVVVAHPEPHGIAGGGADRLREAGVEVVGPGGPHDLLRAAVAIQLEGFLSVVQRGRPHLTLKIAQTSDGGLQAPPPDRWITGPVARRAVHRLRAVRDGVLVGSGTVLTDDPHLDVRDVSATAQPRPIVFDGRLRTPPSSTVVARGALIVTRPDAPARHRRALVAAGAEVVETGCGMVGGVDLEAGLRTLADHGHCSLLAEPGATLARALLDAGLVDRLILHIAVGTGSGGLQRFAPSTHDGAWITERSGGAGSDLVLHLVPDRQRRVRVPLSPTEGT